MTDVAVGTLGPMDATEQTFDDVVLARSHERPVVVDFWADWCGPCHALAPVLESAVAERGGAIELVKVDVDANTGLAQQFRVSGIPAAVEINRSDPALDSLHVDTKAGNDLVSVEPGVHKRLKFSHS